MPKGKCQFKQGVLPTHRYGTSITITTAAATTTLSSATASSTGGSTSFSCDRVQAAARRVAGWKRRKWDGILKFGVA